MWELEHIGGWKESVLDWMKDFPRDKKMGTVVRDRKSHWRWITIGLLQDSLLVLVIFLTHKENQ